MCFIGVRKQTNEKKHLNHLIPENRYFRSGFDVTIFGRKPHYNGHAPCEVSLTGSPRKSYIVNMQIGVADSKYVV